MNSIKIIITSFLINRWHHVKGDLTIVLKNYLVQIPQFLSVIMPQEIAPKRVEHNLNMPNNDWTKMLKWIILEQYIIRLFCQPNKIILSLNPTASMHGSFRLYVDDFIFSISFPLWILKVLTQVAVMWTNKAIHLVIHWPS